MFKEETFDYQIKHCWHAISRMYNQIALLEGITTSMGFVLININSKEGTPATKIAPMMGLESRSITRMLKTMEAKGLIHRRQDLKDKRSVRVLLTKEGKEKRSKAIKTIKRFNTEIGAALTTQEMQSFYKIFEKINLVIQQHNPINQP